MRHINSSHEYRYMRPSHKILDFKIELSSFNRFEIKSSGPNALLLNLDGVI